MGALASAYEKAGDVEKARQQYEKICRLTSGRFYYGDIYARSFYMLGKIADQLGRERQGTRKLSKNSSGYGRTPTPAFPRSRECQEEAGGLKD